MSLRGLIEKLKNGGLAVLVPASAAAFLLVAAALAFSGYLPLPESLRLAIQNINGTAQTANTAAVAYFTTYDGGYPNPLNDYTVYAQDSGASYGCGAHYCWQSTICIDPYVGALSAKSTLQNSASIVQKGGAVSSSGTNVYVGSGNVVTLDYACQPYLTRNYIDGSQPCTRYVGAQTEYFANNVTLTGPSGNTIYSGTTLVGSATTSVTGAIGSTQNYTLTCKSGAATVRSVTTPVKISTAVLGLSASPAIVPVGSSTALSWSASQVVPASCRIVNQAGTTLQTNGQQNTFSYTGGDQTYTVPAGVTSVLVKAWGAGGGTGCNGGEGPGGRGGYTSGTLAVSPGQVLTVIVGQAGTKNGPRTYGGGGHGQYPDFPTYGSGGGRSAIRNAGGTELLTAGGGAGGTGSLCPNYGFGPHEDVFANLGNGVASILSLWPKVAYAADGGHLAGGGGTPPIAGNDGGGTTGNIGGASPYQGADTGAGGGGGGYIGGITGDGISYAAYGGTGYCGSASACTTTTGAGSATGTHGQVTFSVGQTSGSVSSGALSQSGIQNFSIICQDLMGGEVSTTTSVVVGSIPTVTINAGAGNGVTKTVTVGAATPITATFAAGSGDTLAATAINGSDQVTSVPCADVTPYNVSCWTQPNTTKTYAFTPSAAGTYTFYGAAKTNSITAYNNYASVAVVAVQPSVSLALAGAAPQTAGDHAYLTWTSQNITANSCRLYIDSVQVATGLAANYPGSYDAGALSGGSHSIYLTCTPTSGGSFNSNTLAPSVGAPTLSPPFSANPARVRKGGTSYLLWGSTNMTSCTVRDQTNAVISSSLNSSGIQTPVTVSAASTYRISCTNGTSTATAQTTVTLIPGFEEI
ncbi:MAG: hypothetical protein JWL87_558 [Candidatus Adlerbacteria bacterium]|nr:hypothetical protein [Candidatus Adlerbacteria bacterium]